MFSSLFLSKNQKLVKKWKKEHEKIVLLAHKVVAEYSKNNHKKAKKNLISLNNLAIDHIIDEDLKFYKLLNGEKRILPNRKAAIEDFIDTFKDIKPELMSFLTKYTRKDTILDDEFFQNFNELVEVLIERIQYEEKNLYSILDISREKEKWEKIKYNMS